MTRLHALPHGIALAGLILAVAITTGHAEEEAEQDLPHQHLLPETAELIGRLQEGGHVLIVRHERTDATNLDRRSFDLGDCATQRNLSVAGTANASETGEILRTLGIEVGETWSSPMCRTLETARLMFGRATTDPALYGAGMEPEAIRTAMRRLVVDGTGGENNTALVTHLGTYSFVFGRHLAEGDAAVFTVEDGEPTRLGTIPANGWNDAIIDRAARKMSGD